MGWAILPHQSVLGYISLGRSLPIPQSVDEAPSTTSDETKRFSIHRHASPADAGKTARLQSVDENSGFLCIYVYCTATIASPFALLQDGGSQTKRSRGALENLGNYIHSL